MSDDSGSNLICSRRTDAAMNQKVLIKSELEGKDHAFLRGAPLADVSEANAVEQCTEGRRSAERLLYNLGLVSS